MPTETIHSGEDLGGGNATDLDGYLERFKTDFFEWGVLSTTGTFIRVGYVENDGGEKNKEFRGYWSFDLSAVAKERITAAELRWIPFDNAAYAGHSTPNSDLWLGYAFDLWSILEKTNETWNRHTETVELDVLAPAEWMAPPGVEKAWAFPDVFVLQGAGSLFQVALRPYNFSPDTGYHSDHYSGDHNKAFERPRLVLTVSPADPHERKLAVHVDAGIVEADVRVGNL